MPFLWDKPPRVVGHRGSPQEAPENTLASFRAALAAGAAAVELDARLTRDGEVVVFHDARLGRTAPGEAAVESLDAREVVSLDAGSWFAPAFASERVPTLAQALRAMPQALVNVEIKADAANADALPAAVLAVLRKENAVERALVSSFDPDLAAEYAELSGRPAGAIAAFDPDPADLDAWKDLAYVMLAREVAAGPGLDEALAAGKRVLVWTVNDPQEAKGLLARGASGVITDRPGPLLRSGATGA
ncbi:MAG TPA: glycerophosphodiester phosphodiesterase family protein [Candidatus Thermoplasmatota archaeon]|nr:glycerophosphodiester phosphodiesterase family protein [Candidatus Thermoplasmatota archaeon]